MGESAGFHELLQAKELWPMMQGSVLVVRQSLLDDHPQVVQRLVEVTRRGIAFIQSDPHSAARMVSAALDMTGRGIMPSVLADSIRQLKVTPETVYKSLTTKMENTLRVDPAVVQTMIDYTAHLGYIKQSFQARDILDLRYLETGERHD
jgi:NitT/TauT family transport system substrate-binding protein